MKSPRLRSFRLRNFKAVRDSGAVRLTPLTVFIGNNGSGKSSLIEGMETFQAIVEKGLDAAMQAWRGFEYVWHHDDAHELHRPADQRAYHTNPMAFDIRGRLSRGSYSALLEINIGEGGNELFIQREEAKVDQFDYLRRERLGNEERIVEEGPTAGSILRPRRPPDSSSVLKDYLEDSVGRWQFVSLVPDAMGSPHPQKRTGGPVRLARNGSNIAEYLLEIRRLDVGAFNGILEALQYVLPFAVDLQPTLVSALERTVCLNMKEAGFQVPGWLLSSGTLRVLAILALLRHPQGPPLVVIEEIENSLDPRTLHVIVEEIRGAIATGRTQVIATTHSPYLLDLLDLSHLVLVERVDGEPKFIRPADQAELRKWAESFSPGQLYTMGRLSG
jgi:predicted ATPase